MHTEGSCDTEDWSNDAENSFLTSQEYILKYIEIEKSSFNLRCSSLPTTNLWTVVYSFN